MLPFLALFATARADVAPSPSRPLWDDPEAPLPEPPEDLEVALLIAALAAAPLLVRQAAPRAASS